MNISEAKAQLSMLVQAVLDGEEVVISRSGKPAIRLSPYLEQKHPRKPGALKGKIKVNKDFDTLPEELAEAFGADL